jgi:orotidine-5'-phosphate decarboxylase
VQRNDDQKRTATPSAAVKAGADFIVVGRPVIEAPDPAAVAKQIAEEIENI